MDWIYCVENPHESCMKISIITITIIIIHSNMYANTVQRRLRLASMDFQLLLTGLVFDNERISVESYHLIFSIVGLRARSSPYPIIPVDEAERIVSQHASPMEICEMPVSESIVGHVLAQDVEAKEPVPGYRASVVDGYAVRGKIAGQNVRSINYSYI